MKAIWVAVLCVLVLGGVWGYATYDVGDRLHAYNQAVGDIGFVQRGGGRLDEDEIMDELEVLAQTANVEVIEMEVSIEPLDDDNVGRSGTPTRMVAEQLARSSPDRVDGEGIYHADDEVVEMGSGEMSLAGTLIEISVDTRAKKWLWSDRDRVEVRRTVGQRVVMER